MIKQAALFCFLFSFFLTELSAQDTAFYLHGRVVDSLSGDPLRNVKVSLVETMRGTYTNKKGEFTLAVRKVRSVISFSAPGYLTTYTSTPLLPEASHSIRMKKLESKADPAPAISWEKVFRNGNWALLDFELQDNLILALARQEATAKFYLLILDKNGDEKNAIKLREPAVSFYRDYKKQLFVVCEEHAYPVNLNSFSVIEITRATGIKDLEKKIIPWVGEDSVNLYHRLQSGNEYFINTELTVLVRQSSESYFAITKKRKSQNADEEYRL